jgi:hypothetical protein
MRWFTLLALLFMSSAHAQMKPLDASPYVGPGDIAPGAAMWFGVRAYSHAGALSGTKAINIRRSSDNATLDIEVRGNGNLNTQKAAGFCTGVSCFVTEAYDQSGNGLNATQVTAADQPGLTFNCINGTLPCLTYLISIPQALDVTGATSIWTVGTFAAVAIRTAFLGNDGQMMGDHLGTQLAFEAGSPALQVTQPSTNLNSGTATDNVWHSAIGVLAAAAAGQSAAIPDGVATTGTLAASTFGIGMGFGGPTTSGSPLSGNITEGGFWPYVFTSNRWGPMCHNQYQYWATPVPC